MLNFPNTKRTSRQLGLYTDWKDKGGGIGTIVAATGFGKTAIAWMAIEEQNSKRPWRKIHVVVPTIKLKEAWTEPGGYIDNFEFTNVEVFVINTYVSQPRECALLILDEFHRYGAETFKEIFNVSTRKFLLGLTATLEREDGMHEYLLEQAPLIGVVTQDECLREGYISQKKTFNLGLTLGDAENEKLVELNHLFSDSIKKFGENVYKENAFDIAMGCSKGHYVYHSAYIKSLGKTLKMTGTQWRIWWAKENGWDGYSKEHTWSPQNIQKSAGIFNYSMSARKELLYKAEKKIDAAIELVKLYPEKKIMIFGERTDFLDTLVTYFKRNGIKAKALHSNMNGEIRTKATMFEGSKTVAIGRKIDGKVKYVSVDTGIEYAVNEVANAFPNSQKIGKTAYEKEAVDEFKQGDLNVLITANAFDEGIDIPEVEIILITSGKGVRRQQIQREGRGLRYILDKVAIIVNCYIKSSQEENWLKTRQGLEFKTSYFVDKVSDIRLDYKDLELC